MIALSDKPISCNLHKVELEKVIIEGTVYHMCTVCENKSSNRVKKPPSVESKPVSGAKA